MNIPGSNSSIKEGVGAALWLAKVLTLDWIERNPRTALGGAIGMSVIAGVSLFLG